MKYLLFCILLLNTGIGSSADPGPTLAFDGYIEYPAKHDYRIEVYTYPGGLISRVVTYSGEPAKKYEEMIISKGETEVIGSDQFQRNLRTVRMAVAAGAIDMVIENEDLDTHKKTRVAKNVRMNPGEGILFEDDAKKFLLLPNGTFRVEAKNNEDDALVIRWNQIFDDGWYRSDWKSDGTRTAIREYTTMEIPGDWITDGGGVFTGHTLNTADLSINIINYYILDIYSGRPLFLPWLFGLKTGSY